jgi:hypothetical protein
MMTKILATEDDPLNQEMIRWAREILSIREL